MNAENGDDKHTEIKNLEELEAFFKQNEQNTIDNNIQVLKKLETYIHKNVYEDVNQDLLRLKQLNRNLTTWRFQLHSLFINPVTIENNFIVIKDANEKLKSTTKTLILTILEALEVIQLRIKDTEEQMRMPVTQFKYFEMLKCVDFKSLIDNYGDEKNLRTYYFKGLEFAPDPIRYLKDKIFSLEDVIKKCSIKYNQIDFGEYKRIGFAWVNNGYNATKEDIESITLNNVSLNSVLPIEERDNNFSFLILQIACGGALAFHIAFLNKELNKYSESHNFLKSGNCDSALNMCETGAYNKIKKRVISIQQRHSTLESIKHGNEHAARFHKFIFYNLIFIFGERVCNPKYEVNINNGRKRIDIVFDNNNSYGFFKKLNDIHHIKCPKIIIECKNYSTDVSNPEMDQLQGRLNPFRGEFGMLICRSIKNEKLLIERSKDILHDKKNFIIVLDDKDICNLLILKAEGNYKIDNYLLGKFDKLIM